MQDSTNISRYEVGKNYLRELKRIGTNLNQIAKGVNTTGQINEKQMRHTLRTIRDAGKQIIIELTENDDYR